MTMARGNAKLIDLNGIQINVDDTGGTGPAVVMVMGTGSPGRVWQANQVPALVKAGYRVVTFDNRGIAPTSECADGFSIDDMVADTAAVIEHLGVGPVAVVGTSLGGRITQGLLLSRPDLVKATVLMATYGRPTVMQQAISAGERELYDKKITLPDRYFAAITAHLNLSPKTLADENSARDWLDIIEFSGQGFTPGVRAQFDLHVNESNQLAGLSGVRTPTLVIGFADDRTLPVYLAREVADAMPNAEYREVADAGHYGYLERPAEVNKLLVEFLDRTVK